MFFNFADEVVDKNAPGHEDKNDQVSNLLSNFNQLPLPEQTEMIKKHFPQLFGAIFGQGAKKGKEQLTEEHLEQASDEERTNLHKELKHIKIDNVLIGVAKELHFIDPLDAVAHLKSKLTLDNDLDVVNEDGSKVSVQDAVSQLVKEKPHLVYSTQRPGQGSTKQTPGSPLGEKRVYKRSELADSKFYVANREDILLAQRENRIIDDINDAGYVVNTVEKQVTKVKTNE